MVGRTSSTRSPVDVVGRVHHAVWLASPGGGDAKRPPGPQQLRRARRCCCDRRSQLLPRLPQLGHALAHGLDRKAPGPQRVQLSAPEVDRAAPSGVRRGDERAGGVGTKASIDKLRHRKIATLPSCLDAAAASAGPGDARVFLVDVSGVACPGPAGGKLPWALFGVMPMNFWQAGRQWMWLQSGWEGRVTGV